MKNIKLIGGLCLSALALTACNEDYTDWASPQAYGQQPDAAAYGVNVAGAGDIIGDNTGDSVAIAIMTTDRSEITGYKAESLTIDDIAFTSDQLSFSGDTLKVSTLDLADALYKKAGNRVSQRFDLNSKIVFSAMNNAQAVALQSDAKSSYTTPSIPAECSDGYVMLGDFSGYGWDLTKPVKMEKAGDGIYQATVTTANDGSNWYKFYEATPFKKDSTSWDEVNAVVMGVAVKDDAQTPNCLVYANDKVYSDLQTPTISGSGTWTITLNVKNGTFSYERQVSKYFLTGNPNGWSSSSNTMFYCLGGGKYSYTTYFKGAWDVKFWEDKYLGDWSNIWGAGNGDGAASGKLIFGSDAGAFQSPSAGYWTLTLNMNDGSYTWTSVAEGTAYNSVSIIGAFNSWKDEGEVDMTQISPANGDTHNWYAELTLTSATELKFRANHDWSVNWGAAKGTAVDNKVYYGETGNENISVPAGKYKCYLNDITGQWSIVAQE